MMARCGVRIGLVNNMGPLAGHSVMAQFRTALAAADAAVELILLPGLDPAVPEATRREVEARGIDGLIVTGMEPAAATLPSEAMWRPFCALADWVLRQDMPVIWSCLAAHAAVLHRSGVERQRLPRKLSGVYPCYRDSRAHDLAAGLPPRWVCAHSRHNALDAESLAGRGYVILSHSPVAGVDMFAPVGRAAELFMQGHPEYTPGTLRREFLRDLRRFREGARSAPPALPEHYFAAADETQLQPLVAELAAGGDCAFARAYALAHAAKLRSPVQACIGAVYTNWLEQVAARRGAPRPRPMPDQRRATLSVQAYG